MKKQYKIIAIALGAAASLAGAAYYLLFRRPLPHKSGSLHLKGIQGTVEVLRDKWGVPHIYAPIEQDVYFAQGFIHAEERLWQMEFNRRLVGGRLSEILGPAAVSLDRWMRTLSLRQAAEKDIELIDNDAMRMLQSYVDGVNARIARGRLPIEFNILQIKPEPWTILDSIAWGKMMAWNLSVNWETELLRAKIVEKIGAELAAELEPGYYENWPLVMPKDIDYSKLGFSAIDKANSARKLSGPGATSGIGSNNWVLSGSKTSTGKPLLANDMHLGITIPSIWFENHLSSGEMDIIGVSFPGMPGVISGHNNFVAWGFTNGFPDVQDLYMEHLKQNSNGDWLCEYDGEWLKTSVRAEIINIRGEQPVTENVILTRHGPIINSLLPDNFSEVPLALRWTAYEPSKISNALYQMNHAKSCLDMRQALKNWSVPVQNVVYADVKGNIAYSFPGLVPVRRNGDGRFPVPGWITDYEWDGFIPDEKLPHFFNPPQGFIASANNRVAGPDYPYWLGYDCVTGSRAQRINEMIGSQNTIDIAFIKKMQSDLISPAAVELIKALENFTSIDPEIQILMKKMLAWNGSLAEESRQSSIYHVFCIEFLKIVLTPKLGEDLTSRYMGKGPTPVLAEGSLFGERSREFLLDLIKKEQSPWYNLGNQETRDYVIEKAFRNSIDYLKDLLGPSYDNWQWGKLHSLTFSHVLGVNAPLKTLFNRGPFPVGGDGDTIWATLATQHDLSSEKLVGPPYRMIVDMGNLSNSVSQLIPGQSGHPASPHYADNIMEWINGDYHPMLSRFADVKDYAEARLTLLPGQTQ